MSDGLIRWVAIITLVATGSLLWFLTLAYRSTYEASLQASVSKSKIFSELAGRRALAPAVQERLEEGM